MKTIYYILSNTGQVIKCKKFSAWPNFMSSIDGRIIAEDNIGNVTISTVFLGINNSCDESEQPKIFETMVFGGLLNGTESHCATLKQAKAMHKKMVQRVKQSINMDITTKK
jgi:hypothetical protein